MSYLKNIICKVGAVPLIAIFIINSSVTVSEAINKYDASLAELRSIQNNAHEIADSARLLNYPEDSEIIVSAKNTWKLTQSQIVKVQEQAAKEAMSRGGDRGRYVGTFRITSYCPCTTCCGPKAKGITASGAKPIEGITAGAVPGKFPFGTRLFIEGVGERVIQDTGSHPSNRIDIFMSTHQRCYTNGYNLYNAKVYVLD